MKNLFWKIYSILIASIIVVAIIAGVLFFGGQLRVNSFIGLLLVLPALVPPIGLIAFAWGKPIGWLWMWKMFVWILSVISALEFIGRIINMVNQDDSCFGAWCYITEPLSIAFGLPLVIGLYLYAYRSQEIWKVKQLS
ncbi:MAG: hypothetical protein WBC29_00540 [Candidatus Moraniibacteriota bacterium]